MTAVDSVKLASAALANPDPLSLAVHAIATLFACHCPSATPQVTTGAVLSTSPGSHAVPMPLPSVSFWSGFAIVRQLSISSEIPSPSVSEELTVVYAYPESDNNGLFALCAFTVRTSCMPAPVPEGTVYGISMVLDSPGASETLAVDDAVFAHPLVDIALIL